jgi:hypothetical protein
VGVVSLTLLEVPPIQNRVLLGNTWAYDSVWRSTLPISPMDLGTIKKGSAAMSGSKMVGAVGVFVWVLSICMGAAVAGEPDVSVPVFLESERGKVSIERCKEMLGKEGALPADPAGIADVAKLEEVSDAYYSLKNDAWSLGSALKDTVGSEFRSLGDPVTGIPGYTGKTVSDLIEFSTKKEGEYQARFEKFKDAKRNQELAAARGEECRTLGFDSLKPGDRIAVTNNEAQMWFYWEATVVAPEAGAFLVRYGFKGATSEPVLTYCTMMAKLDDKAKSIRKFKNEAEFGAATGGAAGAAFEASGGKQDCTAVRGRDKCMRYPHCSWNSGAGACKDK